MPEDDYKQDALRWRYTQQKGYFYCGDDTDGFSVGVQPEVPPLTHWQSPMHQARYITRCIEGQGKTLQKAIDQALKRHKTGALKRPNYTGLEWPKPIKGL